MPCRLVRLWILAAAACGTAGCVEFRTSHSLCRLWADYNTLGRPAVITERLTHQPYPARQVDSFRWMYNRPIGKQGAALRFLLSPESTGLPAYVPAADVPPADRLETAPSSPRAPAEPLYLPPEPSLSVPPQAPATSPDDPRLDP